MQRKVVVTGGSGFIGSHTVDRLLSNGCKVVVIDNFSTGRPENLSHHQNNSHLEVIQADICDWNATERAYENADWVIHLAALADIVPSIQQPLNYHHANVNGTAIVLELARASKVKRFIYAASSSCYGIPDVYPTPETAPIQPKYPYALTKHLGEEYVLNWGKIYQMPIVSLRFFNVYGPRSRTSGTYGAVFGVFLAQKIHSQPLTVVGDGTQSRDFTFVTDVVSAIIATASSSITNEVMNVGSGNHYPIHRLVQLLGGEVVYIPKRPGEPDITFADISKIKCLLNWSPRVGLEEGVAELLKNIEYWRKAPVWTPYSIQEATADWFKYLK
jgi:UDP-glucose 4-epimerase